MTETVKDFFNLWSVRMAHRFLWRRGELFLNSCRKKLGCLPLKQKLNRGFLVLFSALAVASCGSMQKLNLAKIQPVEPSKRLFVAVLDFKNQSGDEKNNRYSESLAGVMIEELNQSGCFRLVERKRHEELIKELKLSLTGIIDETRAKQIGQQLGVDAFLIGNLAAIGHTYKKPTLGIAWVDSRATEVTLDARLVNVETGEILASSKRSAYVTERMWVAFFFARIGAVSDESYRFQKASLIAIKQIANDLAARAASK